MISGKQIKLARTSLDWTQDHLADKTGLSSNTIYNLERGEISPRPASEQALRIVFEDAGIEFIEQDGIRHCSKDVTAYKGTGSAERFFACLAQSVQKNDQEVVGIFQTSRIFLHLCNLMAGNTKIFEKFATSVSVKCLLPCEFHASNSFCLPPFKLRAAPELSLGTESCFTFGNKHAIILPDGSSTFCFIVINSYHLAHIKHRHFAKLWDAAEPLKVEQGDPILENYAFA